MRRSIFAWAGAAALAALFGSAAAAGDLILAPPDNYETRYDTLWVVVRAPKPPTVLLDGVGVAPGVTEGDIHHLRVEGIKAGGSVLEVRAGKSVEKRRLALTPGGRARGRFHGVKDRDCVECHERNESTCGECHSFRGNAHAKNMARQSCLACHDKPDLSAGELAAGCARCHPDYTVKKHPKLKHPLTGGNDPARPGQGLNCASCHDPHTPACMCKMEKGELREWCRGCHSSN